MTISKDRDKRKKLIKGIFFPFTRDLRESEAYKCLSCRAVKILIESVPIGGRAEPWKWLTDEIFPIVYKPFKRYMGRNQFYAARKEIVKYGFFEEIDDGMPKDPRKKGLKHQKTKFRKSIEWQSISKEMEDERKTKEHSEKMKKIWKDAGLDEPKEEKERDFMDDL